MNKKILIFVGVILVFMVYASLNTACTKKRPKADPEEKEMKDELAENYDALEETEEEAVETKKRHTDWREAMPDDEKKIVEIIKKAWVKEYESEFTDSEKYKLIKERKENIKAKTVSNWIGKIGTLDYDSEQGELCLGVELASGGWRQNFDLFTGRSADPRRLVPYTLKSGTALFEKVIDMKLGDVVKFSGQLYLIDANPLTERHKSLNPLESDLFSVSLVFKFSNVELYEP